MQPACTRLAGRGDFVTTPLIKNSRQKTADALTFAAERAADYVATIAERRVSPSLEAIAALQKFHEAIPEAPTEARDVIALLDDIGSPATVASTGGRYFGFVIGGSLPATVAANWLAAAWDQNAALSTQSPVGAKLEEIASGWL